MKTEESLLAGKGKLTCIQKSLYRDLRYDKSVILSSMLRSMQREWFKALKSNLQTEWIPTEESEDRK